MLAFDKQVRVRFAPSPTGPLHIGGARSALFNWLFAKNTGGVMVVRIEDTDLDRSSVESEQTILDSLRWLGLDWDEGIETGGPHGPYRQSDRLKLYRPYVEKLIASGQAYHCYCSPEELEKERGELLAKGEMPRYRGHCRNLSEEEKQERLARGIKPVVRFKVPPSEQIIIDDLVRGTVVFETDGIGDFIILKSDGYPTYNFAVVIDDLTMQINHVIRGEEHLSNTPRQVLLYKALNEQPPRFAHISLILGEDRAKMSKRHGATSINQYKEKGYLPEALLNFLALLGWSPEGEQEFFTLSELAQAFSLDRVAKSAAVFNLEKLNWMNAHYLRQADPERLADLALPYLAEAGLMRPEPSLKEKEWLQEVVISVREKLEYLAQIPQQAALFFDAAAEEVDPEAREILQGSRPVIEAFYHRIDEIGPFEEDNIKAFLKTLGKDLGLKGKSLYMPVRAAVSGQTWGPELPTIIRLLGRDRVKARLAKSIELIS